MPAYNKNQDCPIMNKNFLFATEFSFEYLIEYWQNLEKDSVFHSIYESRIKPLVDKNHPLLKSGDVRSLVNSYPDEISDLMNIVFSPVMSRTSISAAMALNEFIPVYRTEAYLKNFNDNTQMPEQDEIDKLNNKIILYIYAEILSIYYNLKVSYDASMVVNLRDQSTGLIKSYQSNFDDRFIRVFKKSEPPALSESDRVTLLENLDRIPLLIKMVPPEHFIIRGFTIIHKTDVTEQEIVSEIKRDLLNKNSILRSDNFMRLQDLFRSLLDKPGINAVISAIHNGKVLMLTESFGHCENVRCIYRESLHYELAYFKDSVFEKAIEEKRTVIVNNFPEYCKLNPSCSGDEMIHQKIQSIAVHPLFLDGRLIGIMTLTSAKMFEFDPLNLIRMNDVYPLLSQVIERALEDFDNDVKLLVQNNFTAIHPSIEWRFKKAAVNFIDGNARGIRQEIEPVVFEGVYPLYCATDIRGSSTHRNAAIQADFVDQLNLVRDIIASSERIRQLPILDDYLYRIDAYLTDLKDNLATGDEIEIIRFLQNEIEPSFSDLANFSAAVKNKIDQYTSLLDSEMGTLYRKRKDFDDSVSLINKTISNYLDREQSAAQEMYPHYFDKSTTDGVDQNIYLGESLTEGRKFDRMYLKNLRLWQLITLCGIARLTGGLLPTLKVPLETTHLVVVQDVPLTLTFKTDEKKLAVEGAYNIRYEIMKKRIDKATVKETGERLTQIGKIAIVFTQNAEAAEYRQYIKFLSARGYLEDAVEELHLDDLQGIKGLKALRVGINLKNKAASVIDIGGLLRAV